VPPELAGASVTVSVRLGSGMLEVATTAGTTLRGANSAEHAGTEVIVDLTRYAVAAARRNTLH
jgi:hypothetical protein